MALIRHGQPVLTNLNPHNANRRYLKTRRRGAGGGVDPRLAFHALEGGQGVIIGEGELSAAHTATIYAQDAAGVYQPFAANMPVWEWQDGQQWLKYQPAATNYLVQSRQYGTSWAQSGGVTLSQNQVGIDGAPNTAWTVNDPGASAARINLNPSPQAAAQPHVAKIWIGKDSDQSRFPCFISTNPVHSVQLDTSTGQAMDESGYTPADAIEVLDTGDFWVLLVQYTPTAAGEFRIQPARATTLGGAEDNAVTGSIVLGQCEYHGNKTIAEVRGLGPIFTTTAAASTDRTVYNFEQANQNNTEAAWTCDVFPYVGMDDPLPAAVWWDESLLFFGSAHGITHYANAAPYFGFRNQPSGGGNGTTGGGDAADRPEVMKPYTFGISYHAGEMSAGRLHNGQPSTVWAETLTTFHSAGHETGISLGKPVPANSGMPYGIRNIRRYNITSYAEGKQIIEGLMP